jgi:DNA-binding response OmpR family regulator
MRILVVEDDERIATLLSGAVAAAGFVVEVERDGEVAWYRGDTENFDAVILDLGLPRLDGLTLLRRWRSEGRTVPVLILTARAQWEERVEGIEAGADDYVVKPFSTAELTARIAALLRRSGGTRSRRQLEFEGLQIDLTRREVTVRGRTVDLPAREFDVLAFLASSPQQTFTREELLENVWPRASERHPGTVTEHVGRIRRRIEDDPERPRWVRTVRGVGYRFEP